MTRSTRARAVAASAVAAVLALSACVPADADEETETTAATTSAETVVAETPEPARSLTIHWLAYGSDGGVVGQTELSRKDSETGDLRVEFSENEVGGIGPSAQSGAWNAAIVSTLLMGQPLHGEFRFATSGHIDGPSAGALTTAGLIALQNGHELLDGVTMTGTINPTGTIGPVGGIPEKIKGAADEDFTTVLIPLGQRNVPDQQGQEVDVVRFGEREGVDVIEVGDIYEAYEHLTGEELPKPTVGGEPRLTNLSYDKIEAQVNTTLSRYDAAMQRFNSLAAPLQDLLLQTGLIELAVNAYDQAHNLKQQGQQAGALLSAQESAMLLETAVGAGEWITPMYTRGEDALPLLFEHATNISPTLSRVESFLDQLSTYSPRTVSDVEGLVHAYSGAFDAYTLMIFAHQQIVQIQERFNAGGYGTLEELFADLTQPLLYARLADAMLTSTQGLYEVGRDNPGVPIAEDVDLAQVGDFFRRGAEANEGAFREIVVAEYARAWGVTDEQVLAWLGDKDMAVAFATTERNLLPLIQDAIGEDKPNASYAALAYGVTNYVRNAGLVDKYYNNAQLDPHTHAIVGVRSEAALNRALDLGRQQLGSEIVALRDQDIDPVVSVGSYEAASVLRNGDDGDRFAAVNQYNTGYVSTRVISYLAGRDLSLGAGS
ncbi:MAG: S16 family serine protease [Cellulomonadaceae bacterium]